MKKKTKKAKKNNKPQASLRAKDIISLISETDDLNKIKQSILFHLGQLDRSVDDLSRRLEVIEENMYRDVLDSMALGGQRFGQDDRYDDEDDAPRPWVGDGDGGPKLIGQDGPAGPLFAKETQTRSTECGGGCQDQSSKPTPDLKQ